jgi:hypothetical protein
MRAVPVGQILSAARSEEPRFHFLRGWGMHAEEADLERILRHLRDEQEPPTIARLLQVFSNRAAPRFDARLIELCRHDDAEVRRRALIALENIEHPLVREFALDELEGVVRAESVAGLFIRNYQRGDEHRIREAIRLPGDDDSLHWLLMDIVKVLEANPDADCSQLGVIAYALTPCENCRFHAARLLLDHRVAPGWLVEECRGDSGERCRELVENVGGSTEAAE